MGEEGRVGGLLFVACMFIGTGIGLLFERPDVGGAIGMGIGFLLMALIRVKTIEPSPITMQIPRTFNRISIFIVGLLLIIYNIWYFINIIP